MDTLGPAILSFIERLKWYWKNRVEMPPKSILDKDMYLCIVSVCPLSEVVVYFVHGVVN